MHVFTYTHVCMPMWLQEGMRHKAEDDNQRLRAELLAARKMLADRLRLP